MANYRFYRRVFAGGPLFGAGLSTQVTVLNLDTLALAPIFTDEAGTTEKGNPFNITEIGKFDFWVAAGNYRVTAVTGGLTDEWEGRIGPYSGESSGLAFATEQLSADKTLSPSDVGKLFWVASSTSSNINLTVPASLGDGFYCMWTHAGSGSFTVVASGVTLIPPAGGTLVFSQNSYGSLTVAGSDDVLMVQGNSEAI